MQPCLLWFRFYFVMTSHGFYSKSQASCIGVALLFCTSLVIPSFAELERLEHPAKGDGSLSFLVVGDWGRRGFYNQSHVAFQVWNLSVSLFWPGFYGLYLPGFVVIHVRVAQIANGSIVVSRKHEHPNCRKHYIGSSCLQLDDAKLKLKDLCQKHHQLAVAKFNFIIYQKEKRKGLVDILSTILLIYINSWWD